MTNNIFDILRWLIWLILNIAVFAAEWSATVIIITIAWYIVPLCSEESLLSFRWQIGLVIMICLWYIMARKRI